MRTTRIKTLFFSLTFTGSLFAAGAALADEKTDPAPAPAPEKPKLLIKDLGMSAEVGGGVVGFTDTDARKATDPGGSWTARLTIGTRSLIGAEAAYIGTAQNIQALGLDDSALLMGNGLEANVRVNILQDSVFQPYVFAGLAWKHYSLQNYDYNTSDVADSDNVAEIPVGAGVAYRYAGFIANMRFSLNPALESDLIPSATQGESLRLNNWNVGARVGFEF